MNHSIISLINTIKIAISAKKLKIIVKRKNKNLNFLRYLAKNGIVANIIQKHKVIIVILKYSNSLTPTLSNISTTSKTSHKRTKQGIQNLSFNSIINITENNKKNTRLLGRFR